MCLVIHPIHSVNLGEVCGKPDFPLPFKTKKHLICHKIVHKHPYLNDVYMTPYIGLCFRFPMDGRYLLAAEPTEHKYRFTFGASENYDFVLAGIHAYTEIGQRHMNNPTIKYNEIDLPAIIPMGTNMYFGRQGDVVTEKLLVFESNDALQEYMNKTGRDQFQDSYEKLQELVANWLNYKTLE